jgi:hypothetical protein
MKQFILSLAAAVLFTAHSFAVNTESVTPAVRLHFEKEFGKQTKVTWSKKDAIYTASFEQYGKTVHAFYDQEGEFIGLGQYSSIKQIPLGVERILEERFPGSIVHQAYEFSPENGGIVYGFLISDQRKIRVVRIGSYGDVEIVKSTRKNSAR